MFRISFSSAVGLCVSSLFFGTGCHQEPMAPQDSGPISLLVVSGTGQSGVVGTELPQPLVIKATNAKGNALADITVNFRVTSGGGTMFAGVSSTDSRGIAADYWTLGTSTAATQRVEVRAVLSSGQKQVYGVFTATALPGPATQIAINAGNNQVTTAGAGVTILPSVIVRDQFNNPVSGVAVTFAVATGGGSLTGGSQTTDASGIATVGSWTLGQTAGPNTLTATSTGLTGSPVTFTATATATATDVWTQMAPIPSGGSLLGAAAIQPSGLSDGLVFAVGGVDASGVPALKAFDPTTNTWLTRTSMPTPRAQLGVAAVNGIIYAIGGGNVVDPTDVTAATLVEAYDPLTDSWTSKAPMPTPRYGLAAAVVNGKLYAIGGANTNGLLTTVEMYDPSTNSWTSRAPMPTPRYHLGADVVNGLIYAVGGVTNPDPGSNAFKVIGTVEAYDPVTNSWSTRTAMPTARADLGVVALNGLLYALGGGTESTLALATNEVYDPVGNTWSTKASIPAAVADMGATALGGVIYVVGGNTVVATPTYAYQP